MNNLLETNHYLCLPGFISRKRALALSDSLALHHQQHVMTPDRQVLGALAIHDYLPFVRLLVEKLPAVEAFCEEQILPTYAYARLYGQGEKLLAHQDRDACELSVSLNLDGDEVWPFWLKKPDGAEVAVDLYPGDAVMYLGCATTHWREVFSGSRCNQVFLHYVFSYGKKSSAYFDKKRK